MTLQDCESAVITGWVTNTVETGTVEAWRHEPHGLLWR